MAPSDAFEEATWRGLWWRDTVWAALADYDDGTAGLAAELRNLVVDFREDDSLYATVEILLAMQAAVERVIHEVVAQARLGPIRYSWTEIGVAFGVGRTAAQKRFGKGLTGEHMRFLERELELAIMKLRRYREKAPEEEREELDRKIRVLTNRRGASEAELKYGISDDQIELDLELP